MHIRRMPSRYSFDGLQGLPKLMRLPSGQNLIASSACRQVRLSSSGVECAMTLCL